MFLQPLVEDLLNFFPCFSSFVFFVSIWFFFLSFSSAFLALRPQIRSVLVSLSLVAKQRDLDGRSVLLIYDLLLSVVRAGPRLFICSELYIFVARKRRQCCIRSGSLSWRL